MKICPNCGEKYEGDVKFCRKCGTMLVEEAVEEQKASGPEAAPEVKPEVSSQPESIEEAFGKMLSGENGEKAKGVAGNGPELRIPESVKIPEVKMPEIDTSKIKTPGFLKSKKAKITLAAVVAVIAAIGISVVAVANTPKNKVLLSLNKTVKAIQSGAKEYAGYLNGGSVEVKIGKGDLIYEFLYDDDGEIVSKTYFDFEGQKCAEEFTLKEGSKTVFSGTAVLNEDYLAVSSEEIFGSDAYGINLKKMPENIKGSVFDPDEDTDYAIPQEIFDIITDTKISEYEEKSEKYTKETEKVLTGLAKAFNDSVFKNAELEKGTESLEFADKSVKTQTFELTLDDDAQEAVAKDIQKWMKDDKDLKNLIKELDKEELVSEYLMDEIGFDGFEDIYDNILDALDEFEGDEDISVMYFINRSNGQLVQIKVEIDDTKLTFTFGPDGKNLNYLAFARKSKYSNEKYEIEVEENSSSALSIKVKLGGEALTFNWDKKAGDYKIKAGELSIKGELTKKGSDYTGTVSKIEEYGDTIKPNIEFTFKKSDKAPTLSRYKDILEFRDEDDMEEFLEEIEKNLPRIGAAESVAGPAPEHAY